MIIVKLGKNETASGREMYVEIGGICKVRTKGSGVKNAMTRQDIFGGRQDGGKSYTGCVRSVGVNENGIVVIRIDCSKKYSSMVHDIPVGDIIEVVEVEA